MQNNIKKDFKKVKAFVRYFLINVHLSPNDSSSKTMKDVFYYE